VSVGVIIVAAGRGLRMSETVPKQLLDLGGATIVRRSIAAFDAHPRVARMVVVLLSELVASGRVIGATARPLGIVAGRSAGRLVRLGLEALARTSIRAGSRRGASVRERGADRPCDRRPATPALPCWRFRRATP
jgi:2-C-methyl-D-erythritol 4-phosphate cytidylyltransferase/2-C-methyl-D-erythritol 2,4-cyclodiphosphate synthase